MNYRWEVASSPLAHPSWKLEVLLQNEWSKILDCGILEQKIVNESGFLNKVGWSFCLNLDRLAMELHGVPDARLFRMLVGHDNVMDFEWTNTGSLESIHSKVNN